MQSQAVLSQGVQDLAVMSKGDVSKSLFGQIQWEEILRSGVFLGHRDHQLLERAQENLALTLDNAQDSKDLSSMLLKIAENCTSNLTVQQYAFTRIEEILGLGLDYADTDVEAFGIKHAHLFTTDGKKLIDGPFTRAINSQDSYLQKSSSMAYACLLTATEGNIESLVQWINGKLSSSTNSAWELALPSLSILIRRDSARARFVAAGGVTHIVNILQRIGSAGNAQLVYEIAFVVWSLTLGPDIDLKSFLAAGTIPVMVDLVAAAPSRKVVRMAIGTLRNISNSQNDDALTDMFTAGLQKLLDNIVQSNIHKQASDVEFETDLKVLYETLNANYRDLSTFDRWASQVNTGALRWGIVHTEKFWRENAKFVEPQDFKLLRSLISLLRSEDPSIVSIALYDLGEFTRFYPNGRGIVNALGGKDLALQMIGSENPDLQRQALQCISKIMVTNWEFLR